MAENVELSTAEVNNKLEAVEQGVKAFTEKASAFEQKAKSFEEKAQSLEQKAQKTEQEVAELKSVKEAVTEIRNVKEAVLQVEKNLNEYKVTKDETDKKNQDALDKLIAKGKDIQAGAQSKENFGDMLKKALTENEDLITKMATKDAGRQKNFSIELKAVGDVSIANYTGGTRGLTQLRPGIIEAARRKVHVRDLLVTGQIAAGTEFVFMKENGAGEGAIASVAEGALKPQIDLDLVEASVKIETIAGWLRVTRKAMNNIPGFMSFLQSKLPQKLLAVEDNLLLNGTGVSPQIKGLQVAGNFTAAAGAATIDIEQIVQAMGQLEGVNERTATGIVLHPTDYWNLFLNKAAGSGEYDLPDIVSVNPTTGVISILGVPVVSTSAQTVDKFLVGDFRDGAQLLIQEGIRIEFFEQDGINVRENMVTVRIEETVAFPVYGSDYFVFGDFGNVA